ARRSTERVKQRLNEGMSFIVFPEGTRSEDGKLGPLKKGAFHVAIDVGAVVVPVTIKNAYQIMPKSGRHIYPGVVRTVVHPAIDQFSFVLYRGQKSNRSFRSESPGGNYVQSFKACRVSNRFQFDP